MDPRQADLQLPGQSKSHLSSTLRHKGKKKPDKTAQERGRAISQGRVHLFKVLAVKLALRMETVLLSPAAGPSMPADNKVLGNSTGDTWTLPTRQLGTRTGRSVLLACADTPRTQTGI